MGPLRGIKVVEFTGIGLAPMCAMLLADLGASVLRIDRTVKGELGPPRPLKFDLTLRGRRTVALDLKDDAAAELALKLVAGADVLIEGFRPKVMERLGLGPDACMARNPRLIYCRLTGWGQSGPLAMAAAHDINFIALSGALHAIGRRGGPPVSPMNLLGDLAGGSLYAALGILAAVIERQQSGLGQVIDSAALDGTAALMTHVYGAHAAGMMRERGNNYTDTGAFFYDVYECSDGHWISIGPVENRFYQQLLSLIGVDPGSLPPQSDRDRWPEGRPTLAKVFKTRSREEWCALLEGTDACFAPVLSVAEAPTHPHNQARGNFIAIDGVVQPAPAPKFSRSKPSIPIPPQEPAEGEELEMALAGWLSAPEIAEGRARGVLR